MVPRVLIVDDDPNMVELLRLALNEAGYMVSIAATGTEALHKAKRSPPDLIVLDLLLPGINGYSVCQELRRRPATAAVPVLMITVLPGQFPRLVGREVGADAYLSKPFRTEELVACVGDLLHRTGTASEVVADPMESPAIAAFPSFPAAQSGPGTFSGLAAQH